MRRPKTAGVPLVDNTGGKDGTAAYVEKRSGSILAPKIVRLSLKTTVSWS
jgi:hypothetical protein